MASSASATPPDIAEVRDELFATNATHVFVLRTTDDNLGSHYESRKEVFLVAIDLATASEEYWPLYRVTQTTDFGEDGTGDEIVVTADEGAYAINPYAILAERKAQPWRGPYHGQAVPAIEQSSSGVTITYPDGTAYRLSQDELAARLSDSVEKITANITNHARMGTIDTRQIFAELEVSPELCAVTDPLRYYDLSVGELVQLIRVSCGDEDGMGVTSLITPIPVVAP